MELQVGMPVHYPKGWRGNTDGVIFTVLGVVDDTHVVLAGDKGYRGFCTSNYRKYCKDVELFDSLLDERRIRVAMASKLLILDNIEE